MQHRAATSVNGSRRMPSRSSAYARPGSFAGAKRGARSTPLGTPPRNGASVQAQQAAVAIDNVPQADFGYAY